MLCDEITLEWGRQGGDRLNVKDVQCHDTVTPIMFFYLWTEGPVEGYVSELSEILEMAWRQGLRQGDDQLPRTVLLPAINLKRSIPLVKGANMHGFAQNLPNHVQNAR